MSGRAAIEARQRWLSLSPAYFVVGVFMVVPLAIMVVISFMEQNVYGGAHQTFSLDAYTQVLFEPSDEVKGRLQVLMNDRLTSAETVMAGTWNGDSMRGRLEGSEHQTYAYPKEGVVGWFDNLVVPKGAQNVEGARKFMDFVMDPENIAIQSNFVKYSNAIKGSEKYFGDDMKDSPELNAPAGIPVKFGEACSPKAQKLIECVWTKLLQ